MGGDKMIRLTDYFLNRSCVGKAKLCVSILTIFFLLAGTSVYAAEFDLKGTDVSIGGYAKLMMIYDTGGKVRTGPYEGDVIAAYDIPLDGSPTADKEDFRMTARESRLFLKTTTPSDTGTISTHVEGDFYGEGGTGTYSNSRSFRLRHAYGSWTNGGHILLAGQTWSTFMDLAAALPPMDLSSDPGMTFVRQPMIRYQYNFNPGHYLAVAAENPDNGLTAAGPVSYIKNPGESAELKMPDVVLKYFYANKLLHVSPKVVLRSFELDGESTSGYGLSLTSHVNIGKGHKIYASVLYGDGIGRYGGLGVNSGVGLTDDGDIETVGFISYNGGVSLAITESLLFAVGAGYAENDEDDYNGDNSVLTDSAFKTAFSWHSNIFWKITDSMDCAFGVTGYEKEVMGGGEGDMMRFQSFIRYSF